MTSAAAAAVALGGIAGAASRWALIEIVGAGSWPWGLLLANSIGCLILGAVVAARLRHPVETRWPWPLAVGTGFCGSLTTFSTLALEVADDARREQWADGLGYLALTLVAGAIAVLVGGALVRRAGPTP